MTPFPTTKVTVWEAATAVQLAEYIDPDDITRVLAEIGVAYERWATGVLPNTANSDDVLQAYAPDVARLKKDYGFAAADVIRLGPNQSDRAELRARFLEEHTHADPEVRFFVEGQGLFVLHPPAGPAGDRVVGLHAVSGDLVSLPAGIRHWFDMGEHPRFCAIRLFTTPAGWVAEYTGDRIADRFPRLETVAPR
jgi:1,2-dihydroxy-3-keto-5-methylthiopentene dioxygenase